MRRRCRSSKTKRPLVRHAQNRFGACLKKVVNDIAYRGWLEPFILLCVQNNGGFRGHELAETLAELGFGDVKLKRVYSILQRLEIAGLVASDDEHVNWLAWRRYGITVPGEPRLELWGESFEAYRKETNHFLQLYSEQPVQQKSRRKLQSVPP